MEWWSGGVLDVSSGSTCIQRVQSKSDVIGAQGIKRHATIVRSGFQLYVSRSVDPGLGRSVLLP